MSVKRKSLRTQAEASALKVKLEKKSLQGTRTQIFSNAELNHPAYLRRVD